MRECVGLTSGPGCPEPNLSSILEACWRIGRQREGFVPPDPIDCGGPRNVRVIPIPNTAGVVIRDQVPEFLVRFEPTS